MQGQKFMMLYSAQWNHSSSKQEPILRSIQELVSMFPGHQRDSLYELEADTQVSGLKNFRISSGHEVQNREG